MKFGEFFSHSEQCYSGNSETKHILNQHISKGGSRRAKKSCNVLNVLNVLSVLNMRTHRWPAGPCLSEKRRITNSTFWSSLRNEVFHFFLENVCESWGISGAGWTSDETNTKNIFRYSGSNETMQNVLGSIVFFGGFLKFFLRLKNLENLNFCVFHPIWVKFVMGVTLGKEQHRMSLKWLRLFFDQPNRPTEADIFSTSVFFIQFWLNLVWGLILG